MAIYYHTNVRIHAQTCLAKTDWKVLKAAEEQRNSYNRLHDRFSMMTNRSFPVLTSVRTFRHSHTETTWCSPETRSQLLALAAKSRLPNPQDSGRLHLGRT